LVGFSEQLDTLKELGASVVAASIDTGEKSAEVANELDFPVGEGVTRDIADTLGSWWEDRRQIIQPSEFILDGKGEVVISSYSDGPLGRMEAGDVIRLINRYESLKKANG